MFLFFFWCISGLAQENAHSFTSVIFNILSHHGSCIVPDQVIFDNIPLVRIGTRFMDDCQECIR